MLGSDKQILGSSLETKTKSEKGRPKINRELGYQLIKAGYSNRYICKVLGCKARTVRLMKQELKQKGELEEKQVTEDLDKIAIDFDEECKRAVGISFHDWLKSQVKGYKWIFNFCKLCWEKVWDKPSLVLVKDRDNQLGDQLAMKWLEVFQDDVRRLRRRKKLIRYLFRFLGRHDICDRYLRMSLTREPEEVRELPHITFPDFPVKLDECIRLTEQMLGWEYGLALKFKVVTMMRTGKEAKELMGIKVGEENHSYLIMQNVDEFRLKVTAKRNEVWNVTWLPKTVREDLFKLYSSRLKGEKLFQIDINRLRKVFGDVTEKVVGVRLKLHDLRKVGLSWYHVMGLPLEYVDRFNVGWTDFNTAKKFYLQFREILRKQERKAYEEKIPDWFKQGFKEWLEL